MRALGQWNRTTFFYKDSPLDLKDTRIRKIPFTTKRPTLVEILRIYRDLCMLEFNPSIQKKQQNIPKEKTKLKVEGRDKLSDKHQLKSSKEDGEIETEEKTLNEQQKRIQERIEKK